MNRITVAICLMLSLALLSDSRVLAQTQKVGYVNSAKILQELPEAQDAQKKLDSLGKTWQTELDKMSKQLQQKYEEFQKKEALFSEQARRDQREELVVLEQQGIQFRQQKFGADGELAAATDSLLSPIKKKVMKVIEQVAKEEKLQFIFDRNEQILVLLYGDPAFDYTFKVIDKLKRGRSSGK